MAKKSFKAEIGLEAKGVNAFLGENTAPKTTKKKRPTLEDLGEERATYIVEIQLNEKIKEIAHWERILIKDVLNTALREYVKKYEKQHGAIRPIPEKFK
jgi:hypothetical protein